MADDQPPRGAVPEDEFMLLYKLAQRIVRERGMPVDEFLKIAEAFARDEPKPKRRTRHG
jgi:hypothetical protein